ncbi:MAG: ribosome silencing factor [Verrucomicrobia bacterium]|nr:ribosome silencing factor [Verrucomicrobiota bacterium]
MPSISPTLESDPSSTPVPASKRPASETVARLIAQAAQNKKAEDLVILDLRGISNFTDFYVICSGNSEPQLKAIAEEMQAVLRAEHGVRAKRVDGFPFSHWVVVDFEDVIVHLFHETKRAQYALEDLWGEAPRLEVPLPVPTPPPHSA